MHTKVHQVKASIDPDANGLSLFSGNRHDDARVKGMSKGDGLMEWVVMKEEKKEMRN